MNNKKIYKAQIGSNFSIINISSETHNEVYTETIGDKNNLLEISSDITNNLICSIDCITVKKLKEEEYKIPPYKELFECNLPISALDYRNKEEEFNFKILYNKNELNIILKDKSEIKGYYKNGRIDFFYDNDGYICNIRVNNLNINEYLILKLEELEPGYYMNNYDIINKKSNQK